VLAAWNAASTAFRTILAVSLLVAPELKRRGSDAPHIRHIHFLLYFSTAFVPAHK
jgi:hypothetical protein